MATATPAISLTDRCDALWARGLAHRLVWLNVAVLLAVGVWFRVWQLDHLPGINGDEAWYGIEAMHWMQGKPLNWRTPTNNPLNLLYFLPLALVHLVAEPSPAMLRIPAVLSGLTALPLIFWLARRSFGTQAAVIATVLTAALPVNIAYSRFGWDASQTLPITLPVLLLPLIAMQEPARRQHWLIAAGVAFAAALWVHPTNIFTAPLIVLPAMWMWYEELRSAWMSQSRPRRVLILASAAGGALAVSVLSSHWLLPVAQRLVDLRQLAEFLLHYGRLFSGVTVYRYIAGSGFAEAHWTSWAGAGLLLADLAFWIVALVILETLVRQSRHGWRSREACLLCSWGAMLLGFYLVAGPGAIQPHYERYALCLVAPGIVMAARSFDLRCRAAGQFHGPVVTAGLALAWLLMLGFGSNYFAFIHRTGGRSHATFRTAPVEPKAAALAHVLAHCSTGEETWIVSDEYWNHRPLKYLAAGRPALKVINWSEAQSSEALEAALHERRVWLVEFAGSEKLRLLIGRLQNEGFAARQTDVLDYAGRPVLTLVRPWPLYGSSRAAAAMR